MCGVPRTCHSASKIAAAITALRLSLCSRLNATKASVSGLVSRHLTAGTAWDGRISACYVLVDGAVRRRT